HPRRRLVLAALAVLQYDGRARRPGQQAVEQPLQSTSTTSTSSTILADPAYHRTRELGRRIEAAQDGLEMHAARTAQRLHVGRRERPGEPGVAAAQTPLYVVRRQPQLARDHRGIAGGIAQLGGCDADGVGLLRERQTERVGVEQRAATC